MQLPDALRGVGRPDPPSQRDVPESRYGRFVHWARSAERDLWFVVVAAMLVDVTLTVHGLTLGLTELNPVANAAIDALGVLGLYALKLMALGVGLCCRVAVPDRHGALVPIGLGLPSVLAVAINVTVIASVVL